MTVLEKATKIIAEAFREDAVIHECDTCGEYFKINWMTSEDLKEEFLFILSETGLDFSDDCEIYEGNTTYTFRQLAKAVRSYKY